ncbi:MAG: hypothetical protein HY060_14415 [Proteobacteria bacterium]|nr:hypothetical protein [Pseudomonadota bacterium]
MDGSDFIALDEQQIIQSCFDATIAALHDLGLEVTFSTDMSGWVAMMSSAPNIHLVIPTFNPEHNDLTPDDSFWVKLTRIDDRRDIACIANRLYVTDSFIELMRTQRLWFSRGPRKLVDLVVPPDMPILSGRIGHHGGLWIHPDWRKHGLSGYMTRLARCASLRRFDVDWHCGFVHGTLAEKGLPTAAVTGYAYPRMVLAIDGWNPITDKEDRFYLPWISRAEIRAQLVDETRRLVAHRDQESVRRMAVT